MEFGRTENHVSSWLNVIGWVYRRKLKEKKGPNEMKMEGVGAI
jgi:hypothetical protein